MTIAGEAPASVAREGLFGWLRAGSPAAKRGLFAASLGWMLDSFDVMLYSMVLAAVLGDFGILSYVAEHVLGLPRSY